jgi:predicted RNA binding protein YcfA (HicA-like mRNA interferase family)
MKQLTGKHFIKVLERNGWQLKRINGSHHIFLKQGRVERISVPVHGNKPLKTGLLKNLMKIAGLLESDL